MTTQNGVNYSQREVVHRMPDWVANRRASVNRGHVAPPLTADGMNPRKASFSGSNGEKQGAVYNNCTERVSSRSGGDRIFSFDNRSTSRRESGTNVSVRSLQPVAGRTAVTHTIRFRGARWSQALSNISVALERAIKEDVAACCGISSERIGQMKMKFTDRLVVTFVLDHSHDPSEESRFHNQLKVYNFWRTVALYPRK